MHLSKQTRYQALKDINFWKRFAVGFLVCIMLGIFPMYFLFLKNYSTLSFSYVRSNLIISAIVYGILYSVIALTTAKPSASAVVAGSSAYLLMNFGTISGAIAKITGSNGSAYAITAVSAIIIIAILTVVMYRILREDFLGLFVFIVAIIFLFILVFNTVSTMKSEEAFSPASPTSTASTNDVDNTSIPTLEAPSVPANEATENSSEDDTLSPDELREKILSGEYETSGLPNFYFIIVDEMSGFRAMDTYFDYSTADFKSFLEANNFCYSTSSETIFRDTYQCLSDLLTYTPWTGKTSSYANLNHCTPLRIDLEDMGYKLYSASVDSTIFTEIPSALSELESVVGDRFTADGQTIDDIALENSILKILRTSRNSYQTAEGELLTTEEIKATEAYEKSEYKKYIDNDLRVLDYFEAPDSYIPHSGLAYFGYMQLTHVPFTFKANGSIIEDSEDGKNWSNPDIYLGCYKFAVSHIQKIITTILDNDPDSIVVIMADHGIRYHDDGAYPVFTFIDYPDQKNPLNLVYYRGIKLNIEGLSPMNTVRVILNLMGKEIELLDGVTMEQVLAE